MGKYVESDRVGHVFNDHPKYMIIAAFYFLEFLELDK